MCVDFLVGSATVVHCVFIHPASRARPPTIASTFHSGRNFSPLFRITTISSFIPIAIITASASAIATTTTAVPPHLLVLPPLSLSPSHPLTLSRDTCLLSIPSSLPPPLLSPLPRLPLPLLLPCPASSAPRTRSSAAQVCRVDQPADLCCHVEPVARNDAVMPVDVAQKALVVRRFAVRFIGLVAVLWRWRWWRQ